MLLYGRGSIQMSVAVVITELPIQLSKAAGPRRWRSR